MAAARTCDCCGDFYKAYNYAHNKFKISGFIPANIDSNGQYFTNGVVDLCPKCVEPLHKILEKVKGNEK